MLALARNLEHFHARLSDVWQDSFDGRGDMGSLGKPGLPFFAPAWSAVPAVITFR